jgi:hypothetical protein
MGIIPDYSTSEYDGLIRRELIELIEFQRSEVTRVQLANKMIVEKTQKNLNNMRAQLEKAKDLLVKTRSMLDATASSEHSAWAAELDAFLEIKGKWE